MDKQLKWIVIEGNIGAGKTTAAKALADQLDGTLMLEHFEDNPFLEKFYRGEEVSLLKLETHFLIERFYQIRSFFDRHKSGVLISDYDFIKCLIFGKINLSHSDYQIFSVMFKSFSDHLPKPDLLIYLQMDTLDLVSQIKKRGRGMEREIKLEYLEYLQAGYENLLIGERPKKNTLIMEGKSLMGLSGRHLAKSLLDQIKLFEPE